MAAPNPFHIYHSVRHRINRSQHVREIELVHSPVVGSPELVQTPLQPLVRQLRLRWFMLAVFSLFLIIGLRLMMLQVVQGQAYRQSAEHNRVFVTADPAMRGLFYDRNGKQLVRNEAQFSLQIDGQTIGQTPDQRQAVADQITQYTGIPVAYVISAIDTSIDQQQFTTVKEDIDYQTALRWMGHFRDMPGITIQTEYTRQYLTDQAFGPVLGYTSLLTAEDLEKTDYPYALNARIGRSGLEAQYESILRGTDGQQGYEITSAGDRQTIVESTPAVAGNNLTLTLDQQLQDELYTAIGSYVDGYGTPGGAGVAIDPQTGEVLALVSYPSVGSNQFTKGFSQSEYKKLLDDWRKPLFERAVSGTFPSGSTFKPIVAAAALETGVITESTTVMSVGGIEVGGQRFPDWKEGGHGLTNVTKALAESVNTFFYLAGGGDGSTTEGLGADRIRDYALKFGLAQPVGIDLPGEASGFLPSPGWKEETKNEPWYLGDTYNFSIGQGDVLVTPLQVATYTATIANGGTFYVPHVVKQITDQENNVVQTITPQIRDNQVVSKQTIGIVQEGMQQAVTAGSARQLASLPVSAAAKTGTAQFGSEGKTHSWITVYAPAEHPQIALTVLIEAGGGGDVAAQSVAKQVLQSYFERVTP